MSDNQWDDQDDDSSSDLVKDLRRQLRNQAKELDAIRKENAETKTANRERTVKEVLAAKGVRPEIAKFIPTDADPEQWLTENGELFGVDPAGGPAPAGQASPSGLDAESIAALQAIQRTTSSGNNAQPNSLRDRFNGTESEADISQIFAEQAAQLSGM